jgi:hypothetical protein
VPLRKRKEIQKMSRGCGVVLAAFVILASSAVPDLLAQDQASIWKEYGLVHTDTGQSGKLHYTAYRMKDLTGALAVWEWQRSPNGKPCSQAPFCTADGNRTVILEENYAVVFDSAAPAQSNVDAVLKGLPDKTDTALPAILTFIPRAGLVPDSARYILGNASLKAFAPELASANIGFEQGAEAQIAEYKLAKDTAPTHLAIFYYPTPEMARLHTVQLKLVAGPHVKRSGVLIAVVYGGAADQQADTLLSRVEYEAKITWNDSPPPGPIKPLYALLMNIIYMSILLSALSLAAGLIYAGMRVYRRRYGQLEADEAMTTLHLSGR